MLCFGSYQLVWMRQPGVTILVFLPNRPDKEYMLVLMCASEHDLVNEKYGREYIFFLKRNFFSTALKQKNPEHLSDRGNNICTWIFFLAGFAISLLVLWERHENAILGLIDFWFYNFMVCYFTGTISGFSIVLVCR